MGILCAFMVVPGVLGAIASLGTGVRMVLGIKPRSYGRVASGVKHIIYLRKPLLFLFLVSELLSHL